MVTGPNNLPDPILNTPAVQAARRQPADAVKAQPTAPRPGPGGRYRPVEPPGPDGASRVAGPGALSPRPEVRPSRVEQATAKILSQTSNSGEVNAKLAEKLLTEN